MGEVTPDAILIKCGKWADMTDVITITCAIFGDCRLRVVSLVTSAIALTTLPCDRVILTITDSQTTCLT